MRLFFFYDRNFKVLRDHMVSTLEESGNGGLVLEEDFIEDLGVTKNRAGGGMPTYLYKSTKIREALQKVDEGEIFIFCDVDIQFFRPVEALVLECMGDSVDLVLQREFEDIGVNIGFMGMRNTAACRAYWDAVNVEIKETQGFDQRAANNVLYSGEAEGRFGLRWDRFPMKVWCSALAYPSGTLPEGIVIHHANYVIEYLQASNPASKIAQFAVLRDALLAHGPVSEDWRTSDEPSAQALRTLLADIAATDMMSDYRDKHFGARRPGREWCTLPEGHIARPGGFNFRAWKREQKKLAEAAAEEPAEKKLTEAAAEEPAQASGAAPSEQT